MGTMRLNDMWDQFEGSTFEVKPHYSAQGDCVSLIWEDVEYYGDRHDGVATIYRAFDDDRPVGFLIKDVTTIAKNCQQFGYFADGGTCELSLIVLASGITKTAKFGQTAIEAIRTSGTVELSPTEANGCEASHA